MVDKKLTVVTGTFQELLDKLFLVRPPATIVWDSLGLTSLDLTDEIVAKGAPKKVDVCKPALAKPQDFRVLGSNLLRLANAIRSKVKEGCKVIVISPEERVDTIVDFQVISTKYIPFVYGKFFSKVLGNYFNAIGRMVTVKELGRSGFSRRIYFITDDIIKAKAQGELYTTALNNNGWVEANFTNIFDLLGKNGSAVLIYGDNGVGKSYTSVLTSPAPVYVFYSEPVPTDVVFGDFLNKV